jgi:AMP-binding enzyme
MILDGDTTASGATLDELFRRAGVRAPQALALSDPPNRADFNGGAPRSLSYAEADRAISALAARLGRLGLKADAVIALQLPNTIEAVIALLGVLRAGMIAAPLPLLWRQQEIVGALRGIGAKAIMACARAGSEQPAKGAMLAAAELFPIRHVCAFGDDLPDGVVPLDDIFAPAASDLVHAAARPGPAAAHVAVVTFEVTTSGIVPVARNAAQLIAGGLSVFLEAGLAQQANILATIPPASFAGIALGVVPWLLSGGTLALHHGWDPQALEAQCEALSDATLILPGPALTPLSEAGRLLALERIIALWRAPERLAACPPWYRAARLIDVAAFGETGLVTATRCGDGKPAPIPCGNVAAPRGGGGGNNNTITMLETARTRAGTVALRGPMVPALAFPAGAPLSSDGFVDTGFTCAVAGNDLAITGPPAGLTAIGGYRFAQQAVEALIAVADPAAAIMAVPDGVLGQHLAGRSADPPALIAALQAQGANPLIGRAFRRHLRVGAA